MDAFAQRPLSILLVSAEPDRSDQVVGHLTAMRNTEVYVHVSGTLADALERLSRGDVDVIVMELDLPDSDGLTTFERTTAFSPKVPILVISEREDDEMAIRAVQGGAQDCLPYEELAPSVLRRAIRHGMERQRLMGALRSLALIDDLTGLYNRRGFADLGEQLLKLARRAGKGAALVYVNLDRFRTINDTLGHHMGDRALVRVADILRTTFRRSDVLARMAGDEFAVLAPDSGEEVEDLASRVRGAVEEYNQVSRDPFQLSVSVGVATYDGDGRVRLEDLLAEADRSMYEEKGGKQKMVAQ